MPKTVPSDEFRLVHFGTDRVAEHTFCNNKIRTSLYLRGPLTPFYFLIKGVLIEEFSKLANFYFAVRCHLAASSPHPAASSPHGH